MKIRYIVGRAGKGKSHLVLKEIKQKLEDEHHNKLILLVPEQFKLQAERDLIYKMNLPGIMDVDILSFSTLAHKVFNEVGGLARIHLNDQGKNMILRKVIDESERDLSIYKKASQQDGFIIKLNGIISELKQHEISPQMLKENADHLQGNTILNEKVRDIAIIYEKFNQYIEGRYIDSEDYLNLLIEKMEEAEFLKSTEIWVDGLTNFTPQTYYIMEKLITIAKQVTVTFTFEIGENRDGDLFSIPERAFRKIGNIAKRYAISEELIDLNNNQSEFMGKTPEIAHLERELFAYPYESFHESSKKIILFAGINSLNEIENVAARMVSLVRDEGYRWKDISLICNEMDSYGMLIKRVFEEYSIPCFLDKKRTIMHNPIVEFILSTLTIIQKGYRYEDVFRYFKTGFSGIATEPIEKLENYVLKLGIRGNLWKEPFTRDIGQNLDELNNSRIKFIEPIERLEKKIKNKGQIGETTRAIYEYLHQLNVTEQLEGWIESLKLEGSYEYVNENTQIWNTVMEMLDQLVEIIGEQTVALKEYIRILEAGFESVELGIIPTTVDQVLVGSIQRSKTNDIRAIFVVGANDGILPSKNDDDTILTDDERLLLKAKGMELSNNHENRFCQEKFNIYSAFSKPSEFFWMSYSMADQEGKALRPSVLIERIKKLFKDVKVDSGILESQHQERLICTPGSTFKYMVEGFRMKMDGKPMNDLWLEVYGWYNGRREWDLRKGAIIEGLFHKNQINYIEEKNAKNLYKLPIRASVSRLEQFVRCPFAHFIKYGLRPSKRELYQIEAPDIGQIFHSAMEEFTKKLKEDNLEWRGLEREHCNIMSDAVVDKVVLEHKHGIMESSSRYKYLTNRLKRISRRALWTMTEHIKKGGFKPLEYELSFGLNQAYPPIEIELQDGEKILLEGRIDRIDIFDADKHSFVKIIDYKSGDKDFNLSDVYNGLQLQLIVYLDAVLSNGDKLNRESMKPAGIFYYKIDDPMVKTDEKGLDIIEKEIQKKLKMKGLVLKDVNIVKEMDREINGYSNIIPVGINKDNGFYSNSSVVDNEEFQGLILHVKKLIKEITREMLKGKVCIEPTKSGNQSACTYCSYRSICQFDIMFEENNHKNVKKFTDIEVLEKVLSIGGEAKDGKMD